jgi:iron(III) transport system substrate-binding protein
MHLIQHKASILVFLISLVALISLACSSGAVNQISVEVEEAVEIENSGVVKVEAIKDNRTLLVYSGRAEKLVGNLFDQFTKDTGIKVRVKYAKSPALAATLAEEGNNSWADLFYSQDPASLEAVSVMLDQLPADLLSTVPDWAQSFKHNWIGVSGRARIIVHNSNVNPSELPADLMGFTDAKWKGRIGWPPTNGSFQSMITAMRNMWGEPKTKQWLEGIQANDPKVYAKNTPIVAAVADEEIDVGFVNHYYLHRFQNEQGMEFNASNHYLSGGGPGSIILLSGIGVLSHSKNKDLAETFIQYTLSDHGQTYFVTQTFEHPLVEGVREDITNQECPICAIIPDLTAIGTQTPDYGEQLGDLAATQDLLRTVGLIP